MDRKNPAADSGTPNLHFSGRDSADTGTGQETSVPAEPAPASEKKAVQLFRQNRPETVEPPEDLHDYLRVTSPGVWLVLAAVTLILAGALSWSIFGYITTSVRTAVTVEDGNTVCLIPYDTLRDIPSLPSPWTVNVDGKDYVLNTAGDPETVLISAETSPDIRLAGNLEIGDVVLSFPAETGLADGVYTGTVVTETLHPLSLLME